MRFSTLNYRLKQVHQQLGFVAPLSAGDYAEVMRHLPASALPLFRTMSPADQQHSLRVCRGLLARGCQDKDMLAAALLHDVGKAAGRVPFWTRPVIVLGKQLAPELLKRLVVYPGIEGVCVGAAGSAHQFIAPSAHPKTDEARDGEGAIHCAPTDSIPHWRRSLSYAWYHAEVGAELAASAGLSERAVLYIRTHHQPNGPATRLHEVDEVS
jgi:hypothetical protein